MPGKHGTPGAPGRDGRDGRDTRDGAKGDQGLQGKTGPQGPRGDKGPAGVKGEEGAKGEVGAQDPSCQKGEPFPMPIKNWKECVWKNLNDGKDNGLIKVSCAKITFGAFSCRFCLLLIMRNYAARPVLGA